MLKFYRRQGIEEPNEVHVIRNYLSILNIRFDFKELVIYIKSHYSFPSLLSVTDYLQYKKIDYVLVNLKNWKETHLPAIVYYKDSLCVVLKIKSSQVEYLDPQKGKVEMSLDLFMPNLKHDLVLIINRDRPTLKGAYSIINRAIPIIFVLFFVSMLYKWDIVEVQTLFFIFMNCLGIVSCYNLFMLKHQRSSVSGICEDRESYSFIMSCKNIIESNYSKIFGVDLIDLGICTFSFLLMYTISSVTVQQGEFISLYLVFLISIVPFAVFSIFYQLRKKTLCLLCIAVQFNFLIQTFFYLLWNHRTLHDFVIAILSFNIIKATIICAGIFLLCFISFNYIKQFLLETLKYEDSHMRFLTLKRDLKFIDVFMTNKIDYNPSHLDLQIKAEGSCAFNIFIVLKLSCKHCSEILNSYFRMKESDNLDIQLVIRFIDLNRNDISTLKLFLTNIYDTRLRYLVESSILSCYNTETDESIFEHNTSLNNLAIKSYPQVFINSRKVENYFDLDDIKYMVTMKRKNIL